MRLRYQLLAPNTYTVRGDKPGEYRKVKFTAKDSIRFADAGNLLIASGRDVPAIWEHRSDGKPRPLNRDDWKTEQAKGTFGWVKEYHVDQSGHLYASIDVPDSTDAARAKVVQYCSPGIEHFIESDGKDWGQVITHVAATSRPVQVGQSPVVELSQIKGPLYLSVNVKTGADMDDDKKKNDDDQDQEELVEEVDDNEDVEETPPSPDRLGVALECLTDLGLVLGDDTTMENLIDRIIVAAQTKKAAEGIVDDEVLDTGDELTNVAPTPNQPGVQMSQLKMLQDKLAAVEKDTMKRRINSCAKRRQITPAIQTKLLKTLDKVQLSCNADGNFVSTTLHAQIEAYEALPANNEFASASTHRDVKLSNVRVINTPNVGDSNKTDAELLAIWDGKEAN